MQPYFEPHVFQAVRYFKLKLSHAVTYFELRISHATSFWLPNHKNIIFYSHFQPKFIFLMIHNSFFCTFSDNFEDKSCGVGTFKSPVKPPFHMRRKNKIIYMLFFNNKPNDTRQQNNSNKYYKVIDKIINFKLHNVGIQTMKSNLLRRHLAAY